MAAAVIMVGLVAVASTYPYAMRGVESGRQQSTATFLAEQKIEELKALAANDPGLSSATFTPGTTTETAIAGYPRYTRGTTVAPGTTGTTRLLQITVSYVPAVTVAASNPMRAVSVATVVASRQ